MYVGYSGTIKKLHYKRYNNILKPFVFPEKVIMFWLKSLVFVQNPPFVIKSTITRKRRFQKTDVSFLKSFIFTFARRLSFGVQRGFKLQNSKWRCWKLKATLFLEYYKSKYGKNIHFFHVIVKENLSMLKGFLEILVWPSPYLWIWKRSLLRMLWIT